MFTINSHGVEFSIVGGLEEMVRDLHSMSFFIFNTFFILLYFEFCF